MLVCVEYISSVQLIVCDGFASNAVMKSHMEVLEMSIKQCLDGQFNINTILNKTVRAQLSSYLEIGSNLVSPWFY